MPNPDVNAVCCWIQDHLVTQIHTYCPLLPPLIPIKNMMPSLTFPSFLKLHTGRFTGVIKMVHASQCNVLENPMWRLAYYSTVYVVYELFVSPPERVYGYLFNLYRFRDSSAVTGSPSVSPMSTGSYFISGTTAQSFVSCGWLS